MKWTASMLSTFSLSLALAVGFLAGCSEPPSGPVAATLQVALTSPFSDDGAVLFTVTGGRVDSLEADGLAVYINRPDPATLQVILTGNVSSGAIARIHIADGRLAPKYSAILNQAAARASYLQRDSAAYQLTLKP